MRIREPNKQKGYEHLQTLYRINNVLKKAEADGLDIKRILPNVLKVAAEQLNAQTGTIIIIDKENNVQHGWNVEGAESYEARYIPFLDKVFSDGIAGLASRTKHTVRIDNTLTDNRWLPRPHHITTKQAWSAVCTPLVARQRAIGAITLTKPGHRQFDHEDIDLLGAITSQAAITISNAQFYTETQRQLSEAELFNKASRAINSSLDATKIMDTMLSQMNELFNAEAISIALVDGDELVYTVANGLGSQEIVGLRLPSSQGISGWVMKHAEPAIVNHPKLDERFEGVGEKRTGHPTRAMICAPLQAQGQVMGTIQAINPRKSARFKKEDLNVLVRLAMLASSAIANANQFEKTQAAEQRYVSLFEDSIDPILITSSTGFIREVNRRACAFLGYSRDQLLGESIDKLHKEVILEEASKLLTNTTGEVRVVTSHAVLKDETEVPVEVHMKRTLQHDRDEIQWIYHDISKQVELDQMRDDLTAMLFHDLQNPLSNIISSLELLESEVPQDNEIAGMMMDVASRSSQRLRHLIRSLLDINQLEAGHPVHEVEEVTICEMFSYVQEMLEASFERKHISLNLQVTKTLPLARANKDMIERVIINLMDNAVKFSTRDDTITLSADLTSQNYIVISVADEGPGIPAKFRKSIFDKFYRTPNNPSKGMGLGLAFCRLAVEAHGGQIWAAEAPGGGASFQFTIPAIISAESPAAD